MYKCISILENYSNYSILSITTGKSMQNQKTLKSYCRIQISLEFQLNLFFMVYYTEGVLTTYAQTDVTREPHLTFCRFQTQNRRIKKSLIILDGQVNFNYIANSIKLPTSGPVTNLSVCSRKVKLRKLRTVRMEVENGGGGCCVPAVWAARSVRGTAGELHVEWHPRQGGLSSHVEAPHQLCRTPWRGSEHTECLP